MRTTSEKIPSLLAGDFLFTLVLSARCHTAPDVPLLFVPIQNDPNLIIEIPIVCWQPLGQVFMYRGFGDVKMTGCRPDGGSGLNDVHSEFACPLLQ